MNEEAEIHGEATEKLQELSSKQVADMRLRAQTDLFFMAKGVLQYEQVEEGAHAALCAFMSREQSNRRMVLMPRGFLKSTICTISDSIRLSCINPNIRILLQNEVFENAAGFLEELKNHWTKGVVLRTLFPELVPERITGPGTDWSKSNASINRTTIAKESTYTASGSGGSPQSQHFERVKNDDLVGEKAKESETEMGKAIRWSDAMLPLLDRLSDTMDWYGTRKTMSDVYSHTMEKYKSRIKVFIREPIENGDSIFSKVPLSELINIMVDTPDMWAYDYMNNPLGEGGTDWGKLYTQYFTLTEDRRVVFEDHLTGIISSWKLNELFIVVTADPNGGRPSAPDKAAVIVHGVSPREQIFVLETYSARPSPDGFIEAIFDLCVKWHPARVGIEEAGQQNTMYYFEKHMLEHRTFFDLKPTKHDNKKKDWRIRQALDTPLKTKRLYLQRHQLTLISQIQLHPQLALHNWDEIDCLAQGPQVYEAGMSVEDQQEEKEAESIILSIRGRTGYGNSIRRIHDAPRS